MSLTGCLGLAKQFISLALLPLNANDKPTHPIHLLKPVQAPHPAGNIPHARPFPFVEPF